MPQFVVDTYTGNGTDNRAFTGVGFQPVMVWIIKAGGTHTWKTSSMAGDASMTWNGAAIAANLIQSLDADGFTIGTDTAVNLNTETYYYIAFPTDAETTAVGSYTGDGTDSRDISIGTSWTPAFVLVQRSNGLEAEMWFTSKGGDNAHRFATGIPAWDSNKLQGVGAGSFQVGSSGFTNNNGSTFYYLAFAAAADKFASGSYTGDGTSSHQITQATAFQPIFTMTQSNRNNVTVDDNPFRRIKNMAVGTSVDSNNAVSGAILDFWASGFEVGSNNDVNANTITYHYFSIGPGITPPTLVEPPTVIAPKAKGLALSPAPTPYTRYKSIRAAVAVYNNLVIGP